MSQSMLMVLAVISFIPAAFADENHKGSEMVDVEMKAAAGIGYVLRIEVDREMKTDNPKPRHSITGTKICQSNCWGKYGSPSQCCKLEMVDGISLNLGEYVFLKFRKGHKVFMDAAGGPRFDFEVTKAGKIICIGSVGNPYCKYD